MSVFVFLVSAEKQEIFSQFCPENVSVTRALSLTYRQFGSLVVNRLAITEKFKVDGYTAIIFLLYLQRGSNFCDFLFASLNHQVLRL